MPAPDLRPDGSEDPRAFARRASLTYGDWGRLKRLYKAAEADPLADPALFGALAARLDATPLSQDSDPKPVNLGAPNRGADAVAVAGETLCLLFDRYGQPGEVEFAAYRLQAADALAPRAQGRYSLPDATSLVPCGPLVCALLGGRRAGGFGVFDATDPDAPRWRGQMEIGGLVQAAGAFPRLYLAISAAPDLFSGLGVADLSDPDRPREVGTVTIPGAAGVAVDAGRGLVLVVSGRPGRAGLSVVDVSDPTTPRVVGALPMDDPQCVAVAGTLAFVGGGRAGRVGLSVVDLADPARPREIGHVGAHQPKSVVVHRGFAFLLAKHNWTVQAVDVRDPARPAAASPLPAYSPTGVFASKDTLYVSQTYRGLEMYSVADPAKPRRIGSPPSPATFGYLKRRARRVLRTWAKKDPDAYARLAYETLAAADPAPLDAARQWVCADILYGGSDRLTQGRHGRGPLAPGPARLRLKAREERAPEAWDRHPELASALLTNPALPWQTHEAVFKMLRAADALPADVPDDALASFVSGGSPLLVSFAVRRLTARPGLRGVPPSLAAPAYFKTSRALRLLLEPGLREHGRDDPWGRAFALQSFALAAAAAPGGHLTRRAATALAATARHFGPQVARASVEALLTPLLRAGLADLDSLAAVFARRTPPASALAWLRALDAIGPTRRGPIIGLLEESMAGRAFNAAEAQALVQADSDSVRESGWRLLESSATAAGVLGALWTFLLDSAQETPALRTAMASPAALSLLDRSGLPADDIVRRLRDRPFLVAMLAPETFTAIARRVPASVTLALVGAASDAQWPGLRDAWLVGLAEGAELGALWRAAPTALASADDDRLERRLLGDPDVARTFLDASDPALLDIRDALFGPLLGQWVQAHESLLTRNSALLLQAATHVLPEVRGRALDRAQALGMDLPFALRLLESGLPASVGVGTDFFFGPGAGDARGQGYALALCDSPFAPVRALGFGFIRSRWEALPHDALLSALFETPHPDVQAFVAGLLSANAAQPQKTPRFDREVLRARHTARRAKERIKARQSLEPTLDAATLLALARGKTARDSEWALAQLARLAESGVEIDGVSVSGVFGG